MEKFERFEPKLLRAYTNKTVLYVQKLVMEAQAFVVRGKKRKISAVANPQSMLKWKSRKYWTFLWTENVRLRVPENGGIRTYHSCVHHYYLINPGVVINVAEGDKYDSGLDRVKASLDANDALELMVITDQDIEGTLTDRKKVA